MLKKTIFDSTQENLYKILFMSHKDVLLVINPETKDIEECNDTACRFYGYSREELLSLKISNINILTTEQIQHEMNLAKSQKRNHFYFIHRLKSGELRNVEVKTNPIVLNQTNYLISTITDITDKVKLTDDQIKENYRLESAVSSKTYEIRQELRFKEALFESIPGMLYVYDENQKLVLWNKQHETMTGYTDKELSTFTLDKWFSNEDYSRVMQAVKEVFQKGFGQVEADLIRKDGSTMRMVCNGVPLKMNEKTYFTGVGIDVTEQRADSQKLLENEHLLNLFFQQSLSGFFFMMIDEPVVWNDKTDKEAALDYIFSHQRMSKVNKAMMLQYGLSESEILNHTPNDTFAHDLKQGRDTWRKMLDEGSLHTLTHERKADGSMMWIEGDYICLKDKDGRVTGHFGIQNDVTDRIDAHKKLTHTLDLMKYIIEHSNGGVAVLDTKLNYMFVSQHFIDEYEIKSNIIGKNHYELFPDLPQYWHEIHQQALQGIASSAEDDLYVNPKGDVEWTRWECRPWYNDQGTIGGIVLYAEKTTKNKELEMNLKQQKELLELTLQSVGDAVISCDINGNIFLMNHTAEKLISLSRGLAYGKPIAKILNIRENCKANRTETLIQRIFDTATEEYLCDEAKLVNVDGIELPISGIASPIFNKDNQVSGVVVVFRDISAIKKRQDEIIFASIHDSLTGLKNYRAFDQEIHQMVKAENLPLTIMMGDINGLKIVNDSFGHAMGDKLIMTVANQLVKCCPPNTLIVRYGGDEFVLVFPNMDSDTALSFMNHLKTTCKGTKIGPIDATISLGYETIVSLDQTVQEALTEAENHMYRHKLSENTSQKSKTIDVIMNALYAKNVREMYHSKRVSRICAAFTKALGWQEDEIKEIEIAGILHDIGKIGISETILNKEGKLTDLEWKEIQKHPEIGYRILSTVNEFSELSQYVLEHQEKWNGSGYPRQLKGEAISKQARVIALADAYDAMTSKRTYRVTFTKEEAIAEIRRCAGTQFDPDMVEPFIITLIQELL